MRHDTFGDFHPLVGFSFYTFAILFGMIFNHPFCQLVSLIASVLYAVQVCGKKAVSTLVKFALPVFLLTVIINPAFSHGGVTRLCYLPGGNPLTLESIVYGVSAGTMFVTVIMWFCAFNAEFTSDKFIYVFGRIIPSLSLVISMSLRFVPRFKKQLGEITVAQRCIGRDVSSGNLFRRLKIAVSILSIMVTWALQNTIETADSMKSRGYGLKGRTAFSVYRFFDRDKLMLAWILFAGVFVASGAICGAFEAVYFPSIYFTPPSNVFYVCFLVVYAATLLTPLIVNVMGEKRWKLLQSKI